MSPPVALTAVELARLRAVAAALIPGQDPSPPAVALEELDTLLDDAAAALGVELGDLKAAIALLPEPVDREALERFADEKAAAFELVSTTAAGAYFMAPAVLDSLGYPRGPRSAPRFDLVANELESGILEPVMAMAPLWRSPEHVEREA